MERKPAPPTPYRFPLLRSLWKAVSVGWFVTIREFKPEFVSSFRLLSMNCNMFRLRVMKCAESRLNKCVWINTGTHTHTHTLMPR